MSRYRRRRMQRIRVMLLCPGLDHAQRGFESFARDCFAAFRDDPEIDMRLVKGSGPPGERERALGGPTRDAAAVRAIARVVRARAFRVEHVAFALRVAPLVRRERPDVVYFSEWDVGRVLAVLSRRAPLVLCNGTGAVTGFEHLARVQELTPVALAAVLERGGDPDRHVLLPLGFEIGAGFRPVTADERTRLRGRLGIPTDRPVIVSVAALNATEKRLDYLIEEVARLPAPRPYLVMAGQVEAETPRIRALAARLLGEEGHSIRTLAPGEVGDHLRAADRFVLASVYEALPRALVEALAHGLPCLVHDYPVTRHVLGAHGIFADLTRSGALTELLRAPDAVESEPQRQLARHEHARASFGWDRLRPRYRELFRSVR